MTWLDIVMGALATYYIALSVTKQEGPWRVFERLRNLFLENDWKGRGVRCHVCVSLYSALVVVVGLYALGRVDWPDGLLLWPSLAGASVMLDKYWMRG